jgi:hypothetical protein
VGVFLAQPRYMALPDLTAYVITEVDPTRGCPAAHEARPDHEAEAAIS